jgi:uncharacterized protein (DUF58 family)
MTEAAPNPAGKSGGELRELLARVQRLELIGRKNAAGVLGGNYSTAIPGRGLLFHESRKYVHGESARRIDWNITARVGEPHVRVHLEERQREVVIALDVSPSLHTGFGGVSKLELAVELAATLAVATVTSGDRLGHIVFADQTLAASPPRGGRAQLFRTLRTLLEHTSPWQRPVAESDPRQAIHTVEQWRGRFVLFLISDFIDHDVPQDLRYLRPRHDVALLHVYDPFELEPPSDLRFRAASPEGDATSTPVDPAELAAFAKVRSVLARRAAQHRIDCASFSTTRPLGPALGQFFHRRRGRRR